MKKKIFSLMAVFAFMFSSLNANSIDESQITLDNFDESSDCYDRVIIAVIQADNAGYSATEITWIANAFEAHYCYGYSWDEIYGG